jgi:hypothetical protein
VKGPPLATIFFFKQLNNIEVPLPLSINQNQKDIVSRMTALLASASFDVRAQALEAESIDSHIQSNWLAQLTAALSPRVSSPEIALLLCVK